MKSYEEVAGPGERGAAVFRPEGAGIPDEFVVMDYYCENPDCPGWEIDVLLASLPPARRRIEMRLDLEAGRLSTSKELSHEDQAVVEAFRHDRQTLRNLYRRRQLVRAWGLAQEARHRGRKRAWSGTCYTFKDFDRHGEQYVIEFPREGESWTVLDQYCVNPHCSCVEAMLTFYRTGTGEQRAEPEFDVRLELLTGKAERAESTRGRGLTDRDRQILDAFLAELDDWKAELGRRRSLLRKTALEFVAFPQAPRTTHLEPVDAKPEPEIDPPEEKARPGAMRSVGRNDPCPCGSGKKYKKCCGA